MSNVRSQLLLSKMFGGGMLNRSDRYSRVDITHLPIAITDSGKVLCLPDTNETYHIGFTGMTGKGKGIGGNTLLGFEYWLKKRLCIILNDFQQETFEYSLPNLNEVFNKNLLLINSYPIAYPIVYVYPSNRDLIIREEERNFPLMKMSLPTAEVIDHIEDYYSLDKAKKYITANKEKFRDCNDEEEIREVLDEIIPNQRRFEEMKFKIITVFKNIFDEQICSSSVPDAPAKLAIKKRGWPGIYKNLTVQALMFSGVIPSIQTSEIRSKDWFSAYMAFIVNSIYDGMYHDVFFKDKIVSMYVPEIDKMWKGEGERTKIKEKLGLVGTNGRRASIGLRWDAQDYNAVPDSIKSNTKYLCCMRKANAEEVRDLKKDFNIDAETERAILDLNTDPEKGFFGCVWLTTDKFILYNPVDGTTTTTSSPQRGRLITPLAQHKKPGVKVMDLIK